MKIMILSGLYPPNSKGGAEKVASLLVKELTTLGHTVTVVTTGKRSSLENNGNVHVLSPRNIFWYGEIGRFPFFIRAIWHLIDLFNFAQAQAVEKILAEVKPDLVWSHNLKGLGFLIPRIIKKLGIRHVHTIHDIQLVEASGVARTVHFGLYGRLMRWLIGSPDIVTSPSKWLLSLYQSFNFFPFSDLRVLPHIFADAVHPNEHTSAKNKLLYLGQLEATKGVPFLIEALRGNYALVVAGQGSLLTYVQQNGVDYRGYLFGDEFEKIWSEIDFLIVPSLIIENSPTVILEAFSYGVPVIASNIGGISELVQDGENGFLFEPGNSQSLLEAIKKAKFADYVSLSQKAREQYQILCNDHYKILSEIFTSLL